MSKTFALVVRVTNYYDLRTPNLSICRNDVSEVREALVYGLSIGIEDIVSLGDTGTVTEVRYLC